MWKKNAGRLWLPAALALNLMGCATPSTPLTPPQPAKIPPPPVELMQDPSSGSYSDSVRRLLLEWQQRLTDWRRSS